MTIEVRYLVYFYNGSYENKGFNEVRKLIKEKNTNINYIKAMIYDGTNNSMTTKIVYKNGSRVQNQCKKLKNLIKRRR